jgi:threonine/homoserine/homoserine lactone efflux protein
MIEITLTLFIVGAVTGFIYSMPIAGPISIIIVSKAFQGKVRYCLRTALGAAIVESLFVFIVVYGITALYEIYHPLMPYFLLIGAVFIIIIGLRIRKQKIDLQALETKAIITDKYENRGGLRTGIIINITNPTLFISWFIASFITLSFVSSLGLNIGGLDLIVNENIQSVSDISGSEFSQFENSGSTGNEMQHEKTSEKVSPLFMSLAFALGVGVGAYFWLHLLTKGIIRYRDRIRIDILDKIIYGLGVVIVLIGFYLGYQAIRVFVS